MSYTPSVMPSCQCLYFEWKGIRGAKNGQTCRGNNLCGHMNNYYMFEELELVHEP